MFVDRLERWRFGGWARAHLGRRDFYFYNATHEFTVWRRSVFGAYHYNDGLRAWEARFPKIDDFLVVLPVLFKAHIS